MERRRFLQKVCLSQLLTLTDTADEIYIQVFDGRVNQSQEVDSLLLGRCRFRSSLYLGVLTGAHRFDLDFWRFLVTVP